MPRFVGQSPRGGPGGAAPEHGVVPAQQRVRDLLVAGGDVVRFGGQWLDAGQEAPGRALPEQPLRAADGVVPGEQGGLPVHGRRWVPLGLVERPRRLRELAGVPRLRQRRAGTVPPRVRRSTVSRTTRPEAARNLPAARCSSPEPPRGHASSPVARPIAAPTATSTTRASARCQSTGDTWAKTSAMTRVNSACAHPRPSSGPAANPISMTSGRATANAVGGMPTTRSAAARDRADHRPDQRGPQQRPGLGRRGAQQREDRQQHPEPVRQVEHAREQPGHGERRSQPQRALEVHRPRRQMLAQALPPQPWGGQVGEPQRSGQRRRQAGRRHRRPRDDPHRRDEGLGPLPEAQRERVQPQPVRRHAVRRGGGPVGAERDERGGDAVRVGHRSAVTALGPQPPRRRVRARCRLAQEGGRSGQAGRAVGVGVVQVDGAAQEQPGRPRRDHQRPVATPRRSGPLHRRRPRRPQRVGGLGRVRQQGGEPVPLPRPARPAVRERRQAAGERVDGPAQLRRCTAPASGPATAPARPPRAAAPPASHRPAASPATPGRTAGSTAGCRAAAPRRPARRAADRPPRRS